ncbi:MAG: homoserine O-succinyltransferase [Bacteroidales bacterium]|nr:homoserine O-succinyltransferase [Bacteroidales bacterium]MBR7034645.1 homoserine O-succinyltransferase [Bacteroidales bacterium]
MIFVPKNLPLIATLNAEGVRLCDNTNVPRNAVKMLILNLMPDKEDAEAELYRALDVVDVPISVTLVKMSNLFYKHTPQSYVDTFYTDVAEIMERGEHFDAMIINGAPFERFEYEEIIYWRQLCVFFRWADEHVKSTFHICWSAFARIYYNWNIHFKRNSFQWSGVYPHKILDKTTSLVNPSQTDILLPVSRPWFIAHDELAAVPDVTIIAESPVTGPGLAVAYGGKQVFAISHPEYARDRIRAEFNRDRENGKNPMFPFNYFENNDEHCPVNYSWKADRDWIFTNWMNEFVMR